LALDRADAALVDRGPVPGDHAGLDAAAALISNLADYGVLWVVIAAAQARSPERRARAIGGLAAAGTSSWVVNTLAKAVIARDRPGSDPPARGLVRRPTSSSFPSGHTLAAWCTAVVLADSGPELAAYLAFAAATGLSRVHLGAHHPTDVVGGAALGLAVGLLARQVLVAATTRPR
jgi:undecaprenyl-diphosphatase